ncbi:amino acid permease [Coniophora puteana RWD-64-598 SS2]|uniref:Amino acid permease n=1 Tax=Coniophora puteana (strain RWD-64-598) TaxID=741705 RepID=A0A5M3M9V4_CONPW|nr:amino acid permease [Coniophora puteana RWD-64-598 SS2]EIW75877.1 amino acid permease [Coniophora puteana RWD-64-598 SS2]
MDNAHSLEKGDDFDPKEQGTVTKQLQLSRELKNRHVAMISIGGVLGTGLFLGSATALRDAGPVGALLGYIFTGTIVYCVMISVGEMITLLPIAGGPVNLAERFVDPALGFAYGWCWMYTWTLALPAELSAAATLIDFWHPGVNNAVWITVCLAVAIAINMSGVGVYGESEFIFSSIKVITIVVLIILGIVLDLGGGPTHDRIGFRYWKNPGPFVQYNGIQGNTGRFIGWSRVCIQAAYSYAGTESVSMAAAETKNPRRNLPKAIQRVYFRILVFYIGGVTIMGLLVPFDNPGLNLSASNASASPFVIAINNAGIKGLTSVINAALLTAAWSAASSDLYLSSRGLYGMATAGNAPKVFARTIRGGFPYVAVSFCACFALLAYMSVSSASGEVFTWLSSFTGTANTWSWCAIGITYLRFRKGFRAQGIDESKLVYRSKLQPYAGWWVVIGTGLCLFVRFFSGYQVFLRDSWDTPTFITTYLPVVALPILWIGCKLIRKTKFIHAMDMDFVSGLAEIDALDVEEPPPKNWVERLWAWLVSIPFIWA